MTDNLLCLTCLQSEGAIKTGGNAVAAANVKSTLTPSFFHDLDLAASYPLTSPSNTRVLSQEDSPLIAKTSPHTEKRSWDNIFTPVMLA